MYGFTPDQVDDLASRDFFILKGRIDAIEEKAREATRKLEGR